jgi:predicted RNA-binding protein YlqC (UPF0109 family)
MEDIIKKIAEALVDMPEEVSVSQVNGASTTIIKLHVAQADTGKIIGKQGRTVDAIRTILTAISAKNNKRTVLEVIE